jgi:hypothetical protein
VGAPRAPRAGRPLEPLALGGGGGRARGPARGALGEEGRVRGAGGVPLEHRAPIEHRLTTDAHRGERRLRPLAPPAMSRLDPRRYVGPELPLEVEQVQIEDLHLLVAPLDRGRQRIAHPRSPTRPWVACGGSRASRRLSPAAVLARSAGLVGRNAARGAVAVRHPW